MKKIKIALLLALTLCIVGCNKSKKLGGDVVGEWKLDTYYGVPAASGKVPAVVYLNFKKDGSFELFQCLGDAGHFTAFTGMYETADGLLYGDYDGVESFYWAANYKYSVSGDTLTLEDSDNAGSGECVYVRCSIPAEVRKDAADYAE